MRWHRTGIIQPGLGKMPSHGQGFGYDDRTAFYPLHIRDVPKEEQQGRLQSHLLPLELERPQSDCPDVPNEVEDRTNVQALKSEGYDIEAVNLKTPARRCLLILAAYIALALPVVATFWGIKNSKSFTERTARYT